MIDNDITLSKEKCHLTFSSELYILHNLYLFHRKYIHKVFVGSSPPPITQFQAFKGET